MARNLLRSTEQLAVVEWLAEGLTDQEIVDKLQSEFGKTCTPQNISGNYRKSRMEEIEAAKTARFERACSRGFGSRAARIEALNEVAERIIGHIRSYPVALTFEGGNCIKEFRDTLADLRKECGQETPTKLEHSGPGGGPLEVAVEHDLSDGLTTPERLASVAGILGSLGLLTAGGPGGAEDGAETAHD